LSPKLLHFDFYADPNPDPDPVFHSNADPDPASKNNADPGPQPMLLITRAADPDLDLLTWVILQMIQLISNDDFTYFFCVMRYSEPQQPDPYR
jgi:hypothetical protein